MFVTVFVAATMSFVLLVPVLMVLVLVAAISGRDEARARAVVVTARSAEPVSDRPVRVAA